MVRLEFVQVRDICLPVNLVSSVELVIQLRPCRVVSFLRLFAVDFDIYSLALTEEQLQKESSNLLFRHLLHRFDLVLTRGEIVFLVTDRGPVSDSLIRQFFVLLQKLIYQRCLRRVEFLLDGLPREPIL